MASLVGESPKTETAKFSEKAGHEHIEHAMTGESSSAESKKIISDDGGPEDVTPVSMGKCSILYSADYEYSDVLVSYNVTHRHGVFMDRIS